MKYVRSVVALCISLSLGPVLIAEEYIVPIYAESLGGADALWTSWLLAVNPSPFPVRVRISSGLPLFAGACRSCLEPLPELELEPFGWANLGPGTPSGPTIDAGALVINSTAPIVLHSVVYGDTGERRNVRQRLDIARRWLSPGLHRISAIEPPTRDARMNLFVNNPNDSAIEIRFWIGPREFNERVLSVPPHSTAVTVVDRPRCAPEVECITHTGFPPDPYVLFADSSGEFLMSVSTVERDYAMFVLADEAR